MRATTVVLAVATVVALNDAASIKENSVEDVVSFYKSKFEDLEFPDLKEFRRRRKPFTINVEGIVGTGKSTFLRFLKNYPAIDVLPEPVDKWTNLNGTDMLQLLYDNPKRWALAQESFVQQTMLEEHLRNFGIAKIMERSIHSGRYVFVESLRKSGGLSKVEYDIIARWYTFLNNVPQFDLDTDLTVYLQSDPKVVIKRIKKRGRKEEAHITMDFLEDIQRLHEDWLVHKNSTFPLPSKKILVINTSHPFETMKKVYKNLAKKIWSIIPGALKQEYGCNIY